MTPQTTSPASLPAAVQAYVAAVSSSDLEGLEGLEGTVSSFSSDGLIVDVGRHIRGHDAIRSWARNEVVGGAIEVLEEHPTDAGTDLLVRFTPPGSSNGFRAWYRYQVPGDLISRVDLAYA